MNTGNLIHAWVAIFSLYIFWNNHNAFSFWVLLPLTIWFLKMFKYQNFHIFSYGKNVQFTNNFSFFTCIFTHANYVLERWLIRRPNGITFLYFHKEIVKNQISCCFLGFLLIYTQTVNVCEFWTTGKCILLSIKR